MGKKVIEKSMSLDAYLNEISEERISTDQDVQRVFCQDKKFVDELMITILTEDYIPPIILGEIEDENNITKQYVSDGNQRTQAFNLFKELNWKINTKVENSIIEYQAKRKDKDGKIVRDDNGEAIWDIFEFNVKGKTYNDLPKELQKRFDNYQIRLVIQKCKSMDEISKYVRRYNRNKGMTTNQKGLTWVPKYARKIKNIIDGNFYKNCIPCEEKKNKNGTYEQTVSDSVMTIFHLDDWKRQSEVENRFLNDVSSNEEFDTVEKYLKRIEAVCLDKHQKTFQSNMIHIWAAVFHEFNKYKLDDSKFEKFVDAFEKELHSKEVSGESFDDLVALRGTRNKKNVVDKIDLLNDLMKEFLHIKEEFLNTDEDESIESTYDFVKENVNGELEEEDVELFDEMVKDSVKVDSPVYEQCEKALIALMAYACQKEKDVEFGDWIKKYDRTDETFSPSQKINYMYLKKDFENYIMKTANA